MLSEGCTETASANPPLRAALRSLHPTIPFLSHTICSRFSLSLTPIYFFLLSSLASLRNRRSLHWNTVTRFQVPRLTRNLPQLSNPIYSLFDYVPYDLLSLSLFLSLSLSLSLSRARSSAASSFISQEIDSPHSFLSRRVAHAFFFPFLFLFSHPRSTALLGSVIPFSPLRSSNFLPSSATSSRCGGSARKSSRVLQYDCIFSNHNFCPMPFLDISIMDI